VSDTKPRVAIVFPADPQQLATTPLAQSRFAATADAFRAAGADVVGAAYADHIVEQVRKILLSVDGVLV
jgi:hypothetical protein